MNLAKEIAVPNAAMFMPITCQGKRFLVVKTFAPKPDSKGKPEMEKLAIIKATQIRVSMGLYCNSLKLRLGKTPAMRNSADFTKP